MQLFPADDVDIPEALLRLAEKKLVTLYTVDFVNYIQINNFKKHQHPHHKEANSVIPEPPLPSKAEGKPETNPSDSFNPITDSFNPINSTEQKKCSVPDAEIQIALTLNDKSFYPITKKQCTEWAALFPAVDVPQKLREMKAWCDSNPKKRKTKSGILRFVTTWLAKEQNKGGTVNSIEPPRRVELLP